VRRARAIVAAVGVVAALAACSAPEHNQPVCRPGPPTILMAESVPTATQIPCIERLPEGWAFQTFTASDSSASFSLAQRDGGGTLEVTLLGACPAATRGRATEDRGSTIVWTSAFPGGCTVARLTLSDPAPAGAGTAIHRAMGSISRAEVASVAPTYVAT
jgi:hypothetical protein